MLGRILTVYKPLAVLDVGCGSGRLFQLYNKHGITDIIGVDISSKALAVAKKHFPTVKTYNVRLENMDFPKNRFDLAICNRVLQHLPPHAVANVIDNLCSMSKKVYVNELAQNDSLSEEFFMFRHDYPSLFATCGMKILDEGTIMGSQTGKQTYQLYGLAN